MSVLLCQRLPKEHADGFRFLDTARVGVARRNRAWPGGLEGVHLAPNAALGKWLDLSSFSFVRGAAASFRQRRRC